MMTLDTWFFFAVLQIITAFRNGVGSFNTSTSLSPVEIHEDWGCSCPSFFLMCDWRWQYNHYKSRVYVTKTDHAAAMAPLERWGLVVPSLLVLGGMDIYRGTTLLANNEVGALWPWVAHLGTKIKCPLGISLPDRFAQGCPFQHSPFLGVSF